SVVAPGERRIDDRSQRRQSGTVARVHGEVGGWVADAIAEYLVAPAQIATDHFGIGIEQHLVRIEAMALSRLVRTVDAVAVQLLRSSVRQIAVPDLIGLLGQYNPLRLAVGVGIKET